MGQKTPEIFVYASSNKKWRHIWVPSSFHKARKWRFDYSRFPCICKPSVSFHFILRVERCSKHISSKFKANISGKENSLVLFWRTITESLLSSNCGFYTFWKRVLFWLLFFDFSFCCSWFSGTVEPRLSGPRLSGLFDYPDFFLWSQFFHEY